MAGEEGGQGMEFDINQKEFPSERHKAIWYSGVLVLPEELSLSDKVKELLDAEMVESCRQLRLFVLHLLRAMYENTTCNIEPWQIFSFWLNVMGNLPEQEAYDFIDVTSSMRSKTFAANIKDTYAHLHADTGIELVLREDRTGFVSTLYPKMFRAMKAMQQYVRQKRERATLENSSQLCDFRKIAPGYRYDKTEQRLHMREIEDRIPLIVAGDASASAMEFVSFLRSQKIKLKWTGIQNSYSQTGQVHMGQGLIYIGLGDRYMQGRNDGWLVCVPLENIANYRDALIHEELLGFVVNHIYICTAATQADACNGGEGKYGCLRGVDMDVLGKHVNYACRLRNKKRIAIYVHDPDETAINQIKRLLALEMAAS